MVMSDSSNTCKDTRFRVRKTHFLERLSLPIIDPLNSYFHFNLRPTHCSRSIESPAFIQCCIKSAYYLTQGRQHLVSGGCDHGRLFRHDESGCIPNELVALLGSFAICVTVVEAACGSLLSTTAWSLDEALE
jgi:hypothetical protein